MKNNNFKLILLYSVSNTRNKNQLQRPTAELSCFQKCACYAGIKIFNSITSLISRKAQFKVALKRYLVTHFFNSVDKFVIFTNNTKSHTNSLVFLYYK
jgi:hypothetical protein